MAIAGMKDEISRGLSPVSLALNLLECPGCRPSAPWHWVFKASSSEHGYRDQLWWVETPGQLLPLVLGHSPLGLLAREVDRVGVSETGGSEEC